MEETALQALTWWKVWTYEEQRGGGLYRDHDPVLGAL